jgi:hypothetical protein
MTSQWNERRRQLLEALQHIGGAGRAEGEASDRIPRGFLPVPEHLRLLDPEVVLVVGPRGSGKTQIARVLTEATLFGAVSEYAPAVRLPSPQSEWIPAYPAGKDGFEAVGLSKFIEKHGAGTDSIRDLWFAYLVRVLRHTLQPEEKAGLGPLLDLPGGDVERIHQAFRGASTAPVLALDGLDDRLDREDRHVFLTYDELDTLGGGNWRLIEAGVRGLVALWAAYSRRWKRLRAKVFLRTDLYERHARSGGADLAKLAAGRVELIWSDRHLYGLLLKRMANVDAELAAYVRSVKGIAWDKDKNLGWIPKLRTSQDARPLVERMVGQYMGANKKKGLVFRWLLDHVRNGLGRALPRPFVLLVENAATQELQHFESLKAPRLLEPASLRRALDRVSEDQVAESRDELPWLDTVKERLRANVLVPWDQEREVVRLLEIPTQGPAPAELPFAGRELLAYLVELGIFRRRADGKLDVPDLFLAGLGLKRKGGVKKKR